MRTKEAYLKMISLRNIGKVLELDDNYVRVHRTEVKKGKYPSIDKMEERLNKAGYRKLLEAAWCSNPPVPPSGKSMQDLISEEQIKAGIKQLDEMRELFEMALRDVKNKSDFNKSKKLIN